MPQADATTPRKDSRARGMSVAIVFLCAIMLGMVVWILGYQANLSDKLDILAEELKQRADDTLAPEIERGLTTLEGQIKDAKARLSIKLAALSALSEELEQLGDDTLRPALENDLEVLEAQIKDAKQYPRDADSAEEFLQKTTALSRSLPVWAEVSYLSRITRVRWAALCFRALNPRDTETNAESLEAQLDDIMALIAAIPDGAEGELSGPLEAKARNLRRTVQENSLKGAIQTAKDLLQADLTLERASDEESIKLIDQMIAVRSALGLQLPEDTSEIVHSEIRRLCDELDRKILLAQGNHQTRSLEKQWKLILKLQAARPDLFDVAMADLFQSIIATRTTLGIQGLEIPALDALHTSVKAALGEVTAAATMREEEKHAAAMRRYQRWVLEQVKAFDDAYGRTEKTASDDSKFYKIDNGGWNDDRYKEVMTALIEHLLPVNPGLLDVAVQERYQRTYDKGWKRLDGRDDQTYVAEQSAEVVKKSLRDFTEEEQ